MASTSSRSAWRIWGASSSASASVASAMATSPTDADLASDARHRHRQGQRLAKGPSCLQVPLAVDRHLDDGSGYPEGPVVVGHLAQLQLAQVLEVLADVQAPHLVELEPNGHRRLLQ